MTPNFDLLGERPALILHHGEAVASVAFSPDGKSLATAGFQEEVKLWCASTGKIVGILRGHTEPAFAVAFPSDGSTIATCGFDHTIRFWDPFSFQETLKVNEEEGKPACLAFSLDSRVLAIGTERGIRIWDCVGQKTLGFLRGHERVVYCLSFSPQGQVLASGGEDGIVQFWDVQGLRRQAMFRAEGQVNGVAFAPDGENLVAAGWHGTVKILRPNTQEQVWSWNWKQTNSGIESIYCVTVSPDGRILVSGGDDCWGIGLIRLWEFGSWRQVAILKTNPIGVHSVCFSPDGKRLVSGSHDGTVQIRELSNFVK